MPQAEQTFSPSEPVFREDLDAALALAEELQNRLDLLATRRWRVLLAATILCAGLIGVGLTIFVVSSEHLGWDPPFKGALALSVPVLLSGFLFLVFTEDGMRGRLRTEKRALRQTTRMLHELAGAATLSPIQRELFRVRLSRLDFGPE